MELTPYWPCSWRLNWVLIFTKTALPSYSWEPRKGVIVGVRRGCYVEAKLERLLIIFHAPWQAFCRWAPSSGKAHSQFVVGFFLLANMFLTGLQFMWGWSIIQFVLPQKPKTKKG